MSEDYWVSVPIQVEDLYAAFAEARRRDAQRLKMWREAGWLDGSRSEVGGGGTVRLNYDQAPRAAADRTWPVSLRRWREAVTVGTDGELGRAPITGEDILIIIPDTYLDAFEVHLVADDGTRALVAEGRRLPPLEES